MTDDNTEVNAAPAVEASGKASGSAQRAGTKARSGGSAGKAGKKARPSKKRAVPAAQGATKAKRSAGTAGGGRAGTKQAKLIAMLRGADGVTIEHVAKTFGWQPHTARGAIYGALKKKLGLKVVSEKIEGRGRVYRIAD